MSRRAFHQAFIRDFEDLFQAFTEENSLLPLSKFNSFILNWEGYFKENEFSITGAPVLKCMLWHVFIHFKYGT